MKHRQRDFGAEHHCCGRSGQMVRFTEKVCIESRMDQVPSTPLRSLNLLHPSVHNMKKRIPIEYNSCHRRRLCHLEREDTLMLMKGIVVCSEGSVHGIDVPSATRVSCFQKVQGCMRTGRERVVSFCEREDETSWRLCERPAVSSQTGPPCLLT
jgi:hypothetical protein